MKKEVTTVKNLRDFTNLRRVRAQKNFSQALMAKEIEKATSTYGGIERGDIPVEKDRAEKIAKLVGKTVKSLFKVHKTDKTKLVAI